MLHTCRGRQRSITAMFPSSCRSQVAGVRLLSRAICSVLSSTLSAAVFSSTRETRLVPGIGAMSSPRASSQANAAPEEVDGAGLAVEPAAELFEDAAGPVEN